MRHNRCTGCLAQPCSYANWQLTHGIVLASGSAEGHGTGTCSRCCAVCILACRLTLVLSLMVLCWPMSAATQEATAAATYGSEHSSLMWSPHQRQQSSCWMLAAASVLDGVCGDAG